MAVQTLSIAPSNASDATFRAWGSAIGAAIVSAGLVKTADTGQIDWTTVVRPLAVNTFAGYEVFRFDDALQATHPVFIKVHYGTAGNTSFLNPQMWITVGTATNGAGTITAHASYPNSASTLKSIFYTGTTVWTPVTAQTLWVDSDGGSSLMIAGWLSAGVAMGGTCAVVERTRDFDGTPNTDGVMFLKVPGGTSSGAATLPDYEMVLIGMAPFFSQMTAYSGAPALILSSSAAAGLVPRSGVVGANLYVFPVFTGFSPRLNGPSKHLVVCHLADEPQHAQFSLTHYGASHTFSSLGAWSRGWEHNGTTSCIATGAFRVA